MPTPLCYLLERQPTETINCRQYIHVSLSANVLCHASNFSESTDHRVRLILDPINKVGMPEFLCAMLVLKIPKLSHIDRAEIIE